MPVTRLYFRMSRSQRECLQVGRNLTSALAGLAMPPFCKQVDDPGEGREERHPAEQDVEASHGRLFLAKKRLQPSSSIHRPKPHAATKSENGRSVRSCPNTKPPAATLAASDSLSMSTPRWRSFHSSIVVSADTMCEEYADEDPTENVSGPSVDAAKSAMLASQQIALGDRAGIIHPPQPQVEYVAESGLV